MSSSVVYEALAAGFKEGLKFGVLWVVLRCYLALHDRSSLAKALISGGAASLLAALALLFFPGMRAYKTYLGNISLTSFAFFFIASVGALLESSGFGLFRPFRKVPAFRNAAWLLVFCAAVFFFLPDVLGSAFFLRERAVLSERAFLTYSSAVAGLVAALGVSAVVGRYIPRRLVGGFFDVPQLLLLAAMVKLLGGGSGGLAEISLIPSVQRGLMKFTHDVVHQTFVLLMVPDHPLLKTTVWNFVGFFFGPNLASLESLLILLLFPFLFLYYRLFGPLPATLAESGAESRKLRHGLLSDRRRKALPVIGFILLILIAWFAQGGETISALYVPSPKPVVADKGMVMIPVNDPTMDLRDGALHKFSLSYQGKELRLLVIKRPDGRFAVCLDACEICPPEGYGQRSEYVVCIYCKTPIPVGTLGEAGGCNPIPLLFSSDDRFIRVEMSEIVQKWAYVNSGKGKGGIRR